MESANSIAPLHELVGHTDSVSYVSLSADGAVSLTTSFDGTARTWDVRSGAPLAVFSGHSAITRQCSLSRDGRIAATASRDRSVRVWDARAGKQLFELRRGTKDATGCCLSRDGLLLYATFGSFEGSGDAHDSEIVQADWRGQKVLSAWDTPLEGFPVRLGDCASISDDGKVLVVLVWQYCRQRRGGALSIDTTTGEPVHFWPEHSSECDAAIDSAKRVYVADDTGVSCYDGTADSDGRELVRWDNYLSSRGGAGVDVSRDGSTVLTSARVNYRMWKRHGQAEVRSVACLDGHSAFGHGVAVSDEGHFAVTACFDNVVRVFLLEEPQMVTG
jgi:WD40 repeat protein